MSAAAMGHGGRSPRRLGRLQEEQGQGCHRSRARDLAALSRGQPGDVEAAGEGGVSLLSRGTC